MGLMGQIYEQTSVCSQRALTEAWLGGAKKGPTERQHNPGARADVLLGTG